MLRGGELMKKTFSDEEERVLGVEGKEENYALREAFGTQGANELIQIISFCFSLSEKG
jgi:hypothetical protein